MCSVRVFVCGSQGRVGEVINALCSTNLTYHLNIQEVMSDKSLDGHKPDETSDKNTVLTSNSDDSLDNNHHTYSFCRSPFQQACPFTKRYIYEQRVLTITKRCLSSASLTTLVAMVTLN